MSEPVKVTVGGGVAVVMLHRPEVRNALSAEVLTALGDAVTALDHDERVAAMVLTGADPAFCAGFDLRRLAEPPDEEPPEEAPPDEEPPDEEARGSGPPPGGPIGGRSSPSTGIPEGQRGLLPEHRIPVVGAINGPAVTGGLELALGCDFLVASERASFADTHARVGAMPGAGLTIRLPQLIGVDRARRMSLTGDFVDARRAYEWGLVTEVVPHEELLPRARELATSIATIPAACAREVRRTYEEIGDLTGEAAWHRERELALRWMAERFDRARLAAERSTIVERGRGQA